MSFDERNSVLTPTVAATGTPGNFIRERIRGEQAQGRHEGRVATRFPPEPNGYLHIGHAKSICVNFGLAREFNGTCNLRFDDTNPVTEDTEYVDSIQDDIRWLGFAWSNLFYASDYFEQLYALAEKLIAKGLAYVDSLDEAQIREYRGNFYIKGRPSPFRERSVAENHDLFRRMRAGEFKEGQHVLRAKGDLASQNMNLRDPLLYRIKFAPHHRTGTTWCIYPMYDFAHPLSDALEKITHSICTLEFEAHRPLYDWAIREAEVYPSEQIEFARLHLTYTVLSKRKLIQLVTEKHVEGWDDPRMPSLAGLRRRGYSPESIRTFCERIGVSRTDSVVDYGLLEHCVREDYNARAKRVLGVLRPLKVVIENLPEGEVRTIEAPLHPEDTSHGTRAIPFSRELYIEREDWRDEAPKDWHRLAPGREVRLRYAGLITCREVIRDAQGEPTELRCVMDLGSWGGNAPDGRTVRGTLHWVSAAQAARTEVRLYDRLFTAEFPGTTEGRNFLEEINPDSLVRVNAAVEPWLEANAKPGEVYQFERLGYFCRDAAGGWNRTVTLKDTWAKIEKKGGKAPAPAVEIKEAKKPREAKKPEAPAPAAEVGIEDFQKLDLRVGVVVEAGLVEGADKLLRCMVDLGGEKPRQVFAGLRASYPDPSALVGKRVIVVANLKPRQMKFGLSEGMILAASGKVLAADEGAKAGDRVA